MILRNRRNRISEELKGRIEEFIRRASGAEAPASDAQAVREEALPFPDSMVMYSLDQDAVYKDDALEDLIQSEASEEADEYEDTFKEAAKPGKPREEGPVSGTCSGPAPAAYHSLRPGSHRPAHAAMQELREKESASYQALKEKASLSETRPHNYAAPFGHKDSAKDDIERILRAKEPGFGASLAAKIDELGLKDSGVYRAAQVSKAAFNKIINDRSVPKRQTAVPLVLVLGLGPEQSYRLLEAAGIVLSPSSRFDLIIRYCFENSIRDIDKVNDILYEFDQPLLGSAVR